MADILIITVPATIDNWILLDLKEPLMKRVKFSNANTNSNSNINSNSNSNSNIKNPMKQRMFPMIFATTSNISKEKIDRFYDCPTIVPEVVESFIS